MAFPSDVRVRIPSDASTVYAVYQVINGTTLKGQLKRSETGDLIKEGTVWAEEWMARGVPNAFSGTFTLEGVPSRQSFWLAANWGSQTSYQQVTSQADPVELPDWSLTAADISCPLAVTVPIAAGSTAEKSGTAISFVRADGLDVFTYYIRRGMPRFASSNPDGLVQSELQSPDMSPKIPAGTYYVFPDIWTYLEAPTAFIRRLRNGDTPPAGIPRFVASSGQTVTGTVDFGATQSAVSEWIRPSVEAAAQSGLPATP